MAELLAWLGTGLIVILLVVAVVIDCLTMDGPEPREWE